MEAATFWSSNNRTVARVRVGDVVEKLLKVKSDLKSSQRHLSNLKSRLGRFTKDFNKDICDVTTPEIQ